MYMIMGSFSAPTISSRRPIMVAGPMERNSNPRSMGSVEAFTGGGVGAGSAGRSCAHRKTASPSVAAVAVIGINHRRVELAVFVIYLPKSYRGVSPKVFQ